MDNHKPKIRFFNENVGYKPKNIKKLRFWLIKCAALENKQIKAINFIFCDDSYLLNVNKKYLKHNYFTDIITFNHSENCSILSGDIFISIDRTKENAILYKQTLTKELRRLFAHGLLHLIGYPDKTVKAKEIMRALEDKCLDQFNLE